jgi:hypothetical protein
MIVIIIHLKNDKVMSRKKKVEKNAVCVTSQDTITFRVSIIEPL